MIKYKREISSSFTEYENKYDRLLKDYLSKHDDFTEIYFLELEFEFYSKCYYSSNITESFDEEGNLVYSVNDGNMRGLITEIHESLRDKTLGVNDVWNLELSNIYKATFKRIMNFLESKLNLLKGINLNVENKITSDIVIEPKNKTPEKWHAILYLLELQAANASPPENSEGSLIKDEIEKIGRQRIKGSKGQSFYRNVLKFRLDIKNKKSLKNILAEDWKKKIISLSNNNKIIIDYLEKNY
jgi:hypothetical protein